MDARSLIAPAWKAVVITGASRGFGRAVAVAFAKWESPTPLHFILSARTAEDLQQTETVVREACDPRKQLDFTLHSFDLGRTDQLEKNAECLLSATQFPANRSYGEIVFVNNAGSLGVLAPVGSSLHTASIHTSAFDLNVTAGCFLTAEFVRRLKNKTFLPSATRAAVVNVSSLAAIQAFSTWSIYCAAKAARDMMHKVLAEEIKANPLEERTLSVLNYAPGPMDTDMNAAVRLSEEADPAIKAFYQQLKEQGNNVDPNVSAAKMVRILNDNFYSGDHVDFYDV